MAALVGASRVYTGLHHTTDILASSVMAVAVSYLAWSFILPVLKETGLYSKALAIVE
jgi:membrane-associated phospholipid phosphatase